MEHHDQCAAIGYGRPTKCECQQLSMQPGFIKESGFLQRIKPCQRAVLRKMCPERRFEKGRFILRFGDPATDLHLILSGQVKLVRPSASGQQRIVGICGTDDFIGEAFLHDAGTYRADAVALTDTITCLIGHTQFKALAKQAPEIALIFAEVMATYLARCWDHMSNSYDPIELRVAKVILELTGRFGEPLGQDGWYRLQTELTHDDIGSLTSAVRVSVTGAFQELREAGFVKGTRGEYEIHVPSLLQWIV